MQRRRFLNLMLLSAASPLAAAPEPLPEPKGPFALRDGERAVFVGDSITYAGMFVDYVDAYVQSRFPREKREVLNLGLPSETVSGLSEPDHPYPRPDVHERLERVLERTRPNVLVAGYGMNDGIYYPFSEERLRRYQDGIRLLLEKAARAGARVTLLAPTPFDAGAVARIARPESAFLFSYMNPYAGYDTVLDLYAAWLLTLRDKGVTVVNPRDAIRRHLELRRQTDPAYVLAGDGVHINATGHWFIAAELLKAWNAPGVIDKLELNNPQFVKSDEYTEVEWKAVQPLPYDPAWTPGLVEEAKIPEQFNRYRLHVTRLPAPRYSVDMPGPSGKLYHLGDVKRGELERGIDFAWYPDMPGGWSGKALLERVQQRQRLMGAAWLTAVGHKRPGTPAGLPLDTAKRQAESLDAYIQLFSRELPLKVRLTRLP